MNNYDIKKILNNTVQNNKVLHSYMFIGNKLTKKEEIAKEFAKAILCLSPDNSPCNQCKACIEMQDDNHPDYEMVDLKEDEATIKIEQIRNLQGDIIKKPIVSDKKVYIIKNSDKMTVRSTELSIKNTRRTARICSNDFISRK